MTGQDPWVEPHPEIPYLPKPAPRPPDWLVRHPPVDPEASPEAQALLRYLYGISGRHTLTGQHNFPGRPDYSTDRATAISGKRPALYGTDWGFAVSGDKDSAYVRRALVQKMVRRWEQGSVVALCWHAVPPTEDEPGTFAGNVQSRLTDEQFQRLLTPGTDIHKHWCVQVDMIAEYLKQLQEARVPVLWRPYHEINGDWFWWNGHRGDAAGGTKQLYRQIYERLVRFHGIHNLLWVWNPDRPARADRQFADYFPGQDCVDVLALDCYGAFEQSYYDDLNALSDGKVMAIGETYNLPSLKTFEAQPKWAYYMVWAVDGPADGGREDASGLLDLEMRSLVDSARMLSLDDPTYREGIGPVRAAAQEPLP